MIKTLLTIYFLSVASQAQIVTAESYAQIRPEMQKFYGLVEKIQKYAFDKNEYLKKSNEAEIAEALRQFNETLLKIKSDKIGSEDDMKFRLELLKDSLQEAQLAFQDATKDYSYWALKSSLNQCYSCHTQKSLMGTGFRFSNPGKKSDYLRGEFLYLVRNYSESIPLFESVVQKYPKGSSVEEVENSVQKIIFYYVRVRKDDVETIKQIDRLAQNKKLPFFIQNSFQAWKKYLTVRKYRVSEEQELKTSDDLKEFISSRNDIAGHYRMANQRFIIDLDTTQKLFELLSTNKDPKLKPWVLYWLAYQEKDFQYTMFDNSSELYLRECIENYSKSDAAKKCLQLFKEMTADSFTGSRGTDIPAAVQKQIEKYEKLIKEK